MRRFLPYLLLGLTLGVAAPRVAAYDLDRSLSEPDLNLENLLDLSAYRFRKSLDKQWYNEDNGWRMTGGSLDAKRLFLQTNMKFKKPVAESVDLRMTLDDEVFYAIKPFPRPMIEIAGRPWSIPLELSFLGSPAYDKRQSDLGAAISWGARPWNYTRLVWLAPDYYHNSKNVFDDSRYTQHPRTLKLEGAYRLLDSALESRFHWSRDQPATQVFTNTTGLYQERGHNLHLILDYRATPKRLYGVSYRAFRQDKALAQTGEDRTQALHYDSLDLYGQDRTHAGYEHNVGFRADLLSNRIDDRLDTTRAYTYTIRAPQLYAIRHHTYAPQRAWELGLYVARVTERRDYITGDDTRRGRIEAKLRTSWELHAADRRSTLLFHFTFNLDKLIQDPGDGGGMTYQAVF